MAEKVYHATSKGLRGDCIEPSDRVDITTIGASICRAGMIRRTRDGTGGRLSSAPGRRAGATALAGGEASMGLKASGSGSLPPKNVVTTVAAAKTMATPSIMYAGLSLKGRMVRSLPIATSRNHAMHMRSREASG